MSLSPSKSGPVPSNPCPPPFWLKFEPQQHDVLTARWRNTGKGVGLLPLAGNLCPADPEGLQDRRPGATSRSPGTTTTSTSNCTS